MNMEMNYDNGTHKLVITPQSNVYYLATISSQNMNMSIPLMQYESSPNGMTLVSSVCERIGFSGMTGFCSKVIISSDRRTVTIPGFPVFRRVDSLPPPPRPVPQPPPPRPGTPVPQPPPPPPTPRPVPIPRPRNTANLSTF